jgi:hypothetical protein
LNKPHILGCARPTRFNVLKRTPQLIERRAPRLWIVLSSLQCAVKTGEVLWMKEPYGEGVAIHSGPESCVVVRKGHGEALTGVRLGWVLSREIARNNRGADAVVGSGRLHPARRYRETCGSFARSETPSMDGNTLHGNREIPFLSTAEGAAERIGKSEDTRR